MAITITHVTDAVSASTTTTLTTSSVINASVGDWLVVVFASCYPNTGAASYLDSIVDSDGINSYVVRAQVGYDPGGTNAGQEIVILTCAVTDALTSASITGNFNSGGVHDKTISVYRLQGSGLSFIAADNVGQTGSATNHAANTISVANGNIIFGAASISTNDSITGDSDTLNGNWSTTVAALGDSTIDGTSTTGVSQYKTVTATGNQSWACSTTSARVSARTYVVIHGSAAAFSLAAAQGSYALNGVAATLRKSKAPLAAAAGSYALTGTAAVPGHGWLVTAATGSYALTGTAAGLLHGWKLDAGTAGSYVLTGTDAIPFKTAVAGQTIPAGAGSYVLTGQDANLLHGWVMVAGGMSRTNLIVRSQEFNNAAWAKNALTVSADATAAPDSTTTADRLVENTATTGHYTFSSSATISAATVYTWSVYAKAAGRSWAAVIAYDGTNHSTFFDLTNGVVGTNAAGNTASIEAAANGFYRCIVTRTTAATTTGILTLELASADGVDVYLGDGSSGIYCWGAQLEPGPSATPYIATTSAAVTTTSGGGAYELLGIVTRGLHGWRASAGIDTGLPLLDELGNPLLDEFGDPLLSEGIIGGSYALTGSSVGLNYSLGSKTLIGDSGSYALTGTDVTLTATTLVNKTLVADAGSYSLLGTTANTLFGFKTAAVAGSYLLVGSDVALSKSTAKVIAAEAGSYTLLGTDVALTIGAAPASVSPLHIGEWPIDKKKRRRREDAVAAEQRARKRFRDAIGRLLEGLPPEFDEPEALDEALDSAVLAGNLLYAMSAPIREINAVNELIDHIRQLRIAQPIAQLAMAQAYNQAHRHLKAKAQEDVVMTLLLGE